MLVQGFIDLVGHALTGNSNDKITVMGGAKVYAGAMYAGTPNYDYTGKEVASGNYSVLVQTYTKSILLGTSDTPAKSTDCTINEKERAYSGTVDAQNNKVVVTGTYTNTTSETKIFKEIGLAIRSYEDNTYISILLSRSVFPEPVVIPAGESKSFTITIDFNKFADTVVTA